MKSNSQTTKCTSNSLHKAQKQFKDDLTLTALQVAHDIASPIATLNIILSSTTTLPEEIKTILQTTVARIRDISNTLLKKAKQDLSHTTNDQCTPQILKTLITQSINEANILYKNRVEFYFNIADHADNISALINPVDFCRILSNLINNATEAMENDNRIIITLTNTNNQALIQIQDFGKGIPSYLLDKIGTIGTSFGKTQGTGLGLNHAINTIKKWGSRLLIDSKENKGTIVQLILPKVKIT